MTTDPLGASMLTEGAVTTPPIETELLVLENPSRKLKDDEGEIPSVKPPVFENTTEWVNEDPPPSMTMA